MRIDARQHSEIFFVGDLHGDMQPLLETLKLTRCVAVPDEALAAARVCHAGTKDRSGYPLTIAQQHAIRWTGGTQAIVFLGDVLDNRRSAKDDPIGRCQKTGTQFQMINIVLQLQKEATRTGGKVVFCLGNHDVENVVNTQGSFCSRYAPLRQFDGTRDYDTCDASGGYSETHRTLVRKKLKQAGACVLVRVTNRDNAILACHGGLTDIGTLRPLLDLQPLQFDRNVDVFDRLFRTALLQPKHPHHAQSLRTIQEHDSIMPTWCRPKRLDNQDDLQTFFGATKLIKGHDLQLTAGGASDPNCNVGGKVRPLEKRPMVDGEVCRIDVGMSRAFDTTKVFCVLGVTADPDTNALYRTVYR